MNLDHHLGFVKNPFSKKSSEQELDFLDEIFFTPNYYQALMNDLSNGDSRFIFGQRGHGKSSIINKLFEDLEKSGLFVVKIDRFDSIPLKRNETALIKLILKYIITKLSIFLSVNTKSLKKLTKNEKEKLAFFHRVFYGTLSKTEYKDVYNCFHKIKRRNWAIRIFNRILVKPLNAATSAAVSITSDAVRQSLGLDKVDPKEIYKEYFSEVAEVDYSKLTIDNSSFPKETLKELLDQALQIVKKVGFGNTVILFDKIDEFQDLNQDIVQISNFAKEILTDTDLLMNPNVAIGFSLWSELKSELAGKVRFDKFANIDVSWLEKHMEPLINMRIKYFSVKKDKSLASIMPVQGDREELIRLSNKSPRDLISALGEIYQEQSNVNQNVNAFESESIKIGLLNFCKGYDYDSIYPSKQGKNKEIIAMINRLLYIQQTRFTAKTLTDAYTQSNAQSEGQIKVMISYKLIREDDILGSDGFAYYEVIDPKVEHLIKNVVSKIE